MDKGVRFMIKFLKTIFNINKEKKIIINQKLFNKTTCPFSCEGIISQIDVTDDYNKYKSFPYTYQIK